MHIFKLGVCGALAIVIAAVVACSSGDDPPSQPQQSQIQQSQSAERQVGTDADSSQQEQSGSSSEAGSSEASSDEQEQPANAATEPQQQAESTSSSTTRTQSSADDDEQEEPKQSSGSAESTSKSDDQSSGDQTKDQQQAQSQPEQSDTDVEETPQQSEPSQSDGQSGDAADESDELEQQDQAEPSDREEPDQPQQAEAEEEEEEAQPRQPTAAELLDERAESIRAQSAVVDLVGLNGWLNGQETTIAHEIAKGNVVLIDFWTYTCINCVRTLPFLTAWDEKYRDHGLVILGVHTPEFEFEKDPDNIRAAIAEHNIQYDVPMDNDYRTWRAFRNRYWPAKYLIGPTADGRTMEIRYFHFGEGHYDETEIEIREALEAAGWDLSDVPIGVEIAAPNRAGTPRGRQTRELYGGWRRNTGGGGPYAWQEEYFLGGLGGEVFYSDVPTSSREHNFWYLQGLWRADSEAVVHARETEELEDYLAFLFRGRTANVVLTVAEDGQPFNVYVELDGRPLAAHEAGEHIRWDDQGRSYIRVTENDLYRLVFLPDWSEHEIKLLSNSDQLRIFAFTFGSYVGGE